MFSYPKGCDAPWLVLLYSYLVMFTTIAAVLLPAELVDVTFMVKLVGVVTGVMLPPPQPTAVNSTIRAIAAKVTLMRRRLPNGSSNTPPRTAVEPIAQKPLFPRWLASAPVVFTVNVTVDGFTPSGVTVDGLKLQLTFAGRVPQENCRACENPPSGMTFSVAVPDCPLWMVMFAGSAWKT